MLADLGQLPHDKLLTNRRVAKNNGSMKQNVVGSSTPRLPRFGLRTLLIGMAVLSALFAVMERLGPVWSLLLIWSLVLIAGHVVGNAWGSQAFRSRGSRHEENDSAHSAVASNARVAIASPAQIVLRHSVPGGRARWVFSLLGAIAVGAAGGTFLTFFFLESASMGGIAVWYLSCAVIGALAGYVAGGLLQILAIAIVNEDDVAARWQMRH